MDIQGKRLAVIGGSGFVGSHTVDHLLKQDVRQVVVIDSRPGESAASLAQVEPDPRLRRVEASITDREALRRALAEIDGVFLLAALWLPECADNPRLALDVNVIGAFNVIEACHELGVSRVVFASSVVVYGDPVTTPITEDHPLGSRTLYGATKIAAEQFLRAYHAMVGLPYVSLRYANVYGPHQGRKGPHASVLIRLLERLDSGQPPIIFGDGTQTIDLIYVEDVARANVQAMQADVSDEAFNIASGAAVSINQLVDTLLKLTQAAVTPEYQPQAGRALSQSFSTQKAQARLGFQAQMPLEQGLRALIRWRASAS